MSTEEQLRVSDYDAESTSSVSSTFIPVLPKKSRISLNRSEPEVLIKTESFVPDSEVERDEDSNNRLIGSSSSSQKSGETSFESSSSHEFDSNSSEASGSGGSEELVDIAIRNILFRQPFYYRPKSFTRLVGGSIHRDMNLVSRRPSLLSIKSIKSIKEFFRHKFRKDGGKLGKRKSNVGFHKEPFHSQFEHSHPAAHIQRTKLSRISKKFLGS
jgi:hypothetical protein